MATAEATARVCMCALLSTMAPVGTGMRRARRERQRAWQGHKALLPLLLLLLMGVGGLFVAGYRWGRLQQMDGFVSVLGRLWRCDNAWWGLQQLVVLLLLQELPIAFAAEWSGSCSSCMVLAVCLAHCGAVTAHAGFAGAADGVIAAGATADNMSRQAADTCPNLVLS